MWTTDTLKSITSNWDLLDEHQHKSYLTYMNQHFPPNVFQSHLDKRRRALENAAASKNLLDGAIQTFPDVVNYQSLNLDGNGNGGGGFGCLRGFAVVFTAGGEGERLRLSLLDRGVPAESLRDFTKATYPLKGFYEDFGALQINLAMVSRICYQYGIDIPVVITTGPKGSVTERVIPSILSKHNNFGLPHVKIAAQEERLHFTLDEKTAVRFAGGVPYPVTQPDETGGPLMILKKTAGQDYGNFSNINDIGRLSKPKNGANDAINSSIVILPENGSDTQYGGHPAPSGRALPNLINAVKMLKSKDKVKTAELKQNYDSANSGNVSNINDISRLSTLQWLSDLGCEKLLIVQGTAIYEPKMLAFMAAAASGRDCVGVGIPRSGFGPEDPFGTFVCIDRGGGGGRSVRIVEREIRNEATRAVRDGVTGAYLPFNTGFYAVDRNLLENNDLPDYATPPKEVLPGLPRSPKIGYAATDILPLAKNPLILTVKPDMYAVIKTAEDLETMTETAVRFGLKK